MSGTWINVGDWYGERAKCFVLGAQRCMENLDISLGSCDTPERVHDVVDYMQQRLPMRFPAQVPEGITIYFFRYSPAEAAWEIGATHPSFPVAPLGKPLERIFLGSSS